MSRVDLVKSYMITQWRTKHLPVAEREPPVEHEVRRGAAPPGSEVLDCGEDLLVGMLVYAAFRGPDCTLLKLAMTAVDL